jgi:hypothetical protein
MTRLVRRRGRAQIDEQSVAVPFVPDGGQLTLPRPPDAIVFASCVASPGRLPQRGKSPYINSMVPGRIVEQPELAARMPQPPERVDHRRHSVAHFPGRYDPECIMYRQDLERVPKTSGVVHR